MQHYYGPQYDIQTGGHHQGYGDEDIYDGFWGQGSLYIDLPRSRLYDASFNCTPGFQVRRRTWPGSPEVRDVGYAAVISTEASILPLATHTQRLVLPTHRNNSRLVPSPSLALPPFSLTNSVLCPVDEQRKPQCNRRRRNHGIHGPRSRSGRATPHKLGQRHVVSGHLRGGAERIRD